METKKVQSYRGRGSDFVFQEPIHTSGFYIKLFIN